MDLISFSRMTQNVGIKSSAHLRWLLLLLRASFPERRPQATGVNKLHDPSFRAHPFRLTCDAFEFHERELRRAVANDAKSLSCGVFVLRSFHSKLKLFII